MAIRKATSSASPRPPVVVPGELRVPIVVENFVAPHEVPPADPGLRITGDKVTATDIELGTARFMALRRRNEARWAFIDAHDLTMAEAARLLPFCGRPVFRDEDGFARAMRQSRRRRD